MTAGAGTTDWIPIINAVFAGLASLLLIWVGRKVVTLDVKANTLDAKADALDAKADAAATLGTKNAEKLSGLKEKATEMAAEHRGQMSVLQEQGNGNRTEMLNRLVEANEKIATLEARLGEVTALLTKMAEEKAIADKAIADKAIADKAIADKAIEIAARALEEKAIAARALEEKALADRAREQATVTAAKVAETMAVPVAVPETPLQTAEEKKNH